MKYFIGERMALSHHIEIFDPKTERIEDYKERFDFYCTAHGIAENKQKALFLTSIGQKMYSKLKTWVSPTPFSELSLDQLIVKLKERTREETVEIAERYRFLKRLQQPDESVIDYMSELRTLAKTCNFAEYLNTALRDQFVCGLRDSRIQRELLSMKNLTVTQAFEKSQAMEVASKEIQNFQHEPSAPSPGLRVEEGGHTHVVSRGSKEDHCTRCGNPNHIAAVCPHKHKYCNTCGKQGHLARVCRSNGKKSTNPRKAVVRKARGTHLLEVTTEDDCELESNDDDDELFEVGIHALGQGTRYKKLVTSLVVNDTVLQFEVDTGAELSTIPWAIYHAKLNHTSLQPSSVVLRQYDGTILPTKGKITVTVRQGQQLLLGSFIIVENADRQLPLLGRDWLYRLRLDWPKLFHLCAGEDPRVQTVQSTKWLQEFPDVTKGGLGLLRGIKARVEVESNVRPKFCKSRPVPFALRDQVEKVLKQQVADGELKPVEHSEWAAPIVIVRKKDGGIRICADFKVTINPHLRSTTFPLPTPDEVFSTLAGGESFSTLDLARAYKQMEVEAESQPYLTINTHMGLFRYQRLPFGIATAPAIWQRAMSVVLQGCNGVVYYIDDILVTGKTRSEHEHNLRQVFTRLQQFGLQIQLSKCRFFQESVTYLGHTITREGVRPTQERIYGILNAPRPQNKAELKSFLGLMTYNVRFLQSISDILHPLYKLTKKDAKWKWTRQCEKAFKDAKQLVSNAPTLAHYDVTKPIKLFCDASPRGVGACMMQIVDGQERPVAYASRTLTVAESNYAQIEREALAIIFAVRKFHQYLFGKKFILVTDHQPLCKLLGHDKGIPSLAAARIQRWALILSAYQYTLQYIPGTDNQCADCMSRLPTIGATRDNAEHMCSILAMDLSSLPVTAHDIAAATKKDRTLALILQRVRHGNWPQHTPAHLLPYKRRQSELTCQDDCVLWGQRVIIPEVLRPRLLRELHDGHVGVCRMKALARSYIWWPGVDKEIEDLAKGCEPCRSVSAMPTTAPRHPWQSPNSPWDRIHVDFGEWNRKHFLVVVDAYSKWPEVRYMSSTTAQHTIEVLQDIFATHGFPRLLVSDNGPQFIADNFTTYLCSNQIAHHKSAPYHPATNGLAENMVKNVKQWLKKQETGATFSAMLSDFLRTYRNVPHTETRRSPAELVFGRAPRTHLSMVLPNTGERLKSRLQPSETLKNSRSFKPGDAVWVRDCRPSASHKWEKGVIEAAVGPLSYIVDISGSSQRKVHIDHLMERLPTKTLVDTNPDLPMEAISDGDVGISSAVTEAPQEPIATSASSDVEEPTVMPSTAISEREEAFAQANPSPLTSSPPKIARRQSSRQVKAPKRLIEEL